MNLLLRSISRTLMGVAVASLALTTVAYSGSSIRCEGQCGQPIQNVDTMEWSCEQRCFDDSRCECVYLEGTDSQGNVIRRCQCDPR